MTEAFFDQFIDDYYAESDEHLATVRTILLAAEGSAKPLSTPERADLMRALHTLKGLSGMVGFAAAESLAHALEDRLRAAFAAGPRLDEATLAAMFEGARLMEQCLAAHRAREPEPDTRPFLARVNLPEPAGPVKDSASAVAAPAGTPAETIELDFTPSSALSQAGITVDVMRERLAGLGRIARVTPEMKAGGISFHFVVEAAAGTAVPAEWLEQGLTQRAVAPREPAPRDATRDGVLAASNIVRIDLARLDELMLLAGDLVMTRARLEQGVAQLDHRSQEAVYLADVSSTLERQVRALRDAIMRVRMVPIAEVFERMRFAAREAARDSGRQVRVELHGQDTEVDKMVVERMMEPLLHLVRNAVGHGIECSAERIAAGKDPVGVVELRAQLAGDRLIVQIRDDGRGIDTAAVTLRARDQSLLDDAAELSDAALLDVLAAEGFSTRDEADLTSGRGVGMAVVQRRVSEMGGVLTLDTAPGSGSQFTITLPVTLLIMDVIEFTMAGRSMAVPKQGVREVMQLDQQEITHLEQNDVVSWRDRVMPIVRLDRLLGVTAPPALGRLHVLVLAHAGEPVGIVVDRITGLREVVVRRLADPLVRVRGIAGATELANGGVALIIDAADIAARAVRGAQQNGIRT